jgi:DNA invertase Pin-like site-specific DNA recombinase
MDAAGAAIYVRVSTEEQGDRNLSLPAQLAACRRLAEERGWSVVHEYRDVASAKSDRREGFQALIADAARGHFQVVIVFKYSRFARNDFDSQLYEAELNRRGITLVSATEPVDASTSAGWLSKRMMQIIAEFENRQKADFVRAGMRQLLEQGGWPWRAPLGYVNRREQLDAKHVRKWVEPDSEAAPLVRRAFELAALGELSLCAICDELARRGLRTQFGKLLTPQTLLWLLRNEFYAGIVASVRFGVRVRGVHEPLVSADLFDRVQAALTVRQRAPRHAPKQPFALRGLLFCACGHRVSIDGPHKGKYTYLSCMSYVKRRRDGCRKRLARMDRVVLHLEEEVLPALYVDAADVAGVREELLSLSSAEEGGIEEELTGLASRLARARRRRETLLDLRLDKELDQDEYERKKRSLDREIGIMTARQTELEARRRDRLANVDTVLRVANSLPQLWAAADEVERGELLRCVFERLVIGEGRVVKAVLREPFRLLEGRKGLALEAFQRESAAAEEVVSGEA